MIRIRPSWWTAGPAAADGPVTSALAEAAGDVVLGGLLRRVGEDLLGVVDFDQPAGLARRLQVEERGLVADAGSLLHVVRDDHDREVLLQLGDEVFDRERRDRVERRTRLVHQE